MMRISSIALFASVVCVSLCACSGTSLTGAGSTTKKDNTGPPDDPEIEPADIPVAVTGSFLAGCDFAAEADSADRRAVGYGCAVHTDDGVNAATRKITEITAIFDDGTTAIPALTAANGTSEWQEVLTLPPVAAGKLKTLSVVHTDLEGQDAQTSIATPTTMAAAHRFINSDTNVWEQAFPLVELHAQPHAAEGSYWFAFYVLATTPTIEAQFIAAAKASTHYSVDYSETQRDLFLLPPAEDCKPVGNDPTSDAKRQNDLNCLKNETRTDGTENMYAVVFQSNSYPAYLAFVGSAAKTYVWLSDPNNRAWDLYGAFGRVSTAKTSAPALCRFSYAAVPLSDLLYHRRFRWENCDAKVPADVDKSSDWKYELQLGYTL